MFAAIKARFGGNEATKRTQKALLKQQYENFASSSESLDSIFNRLQKLVSRLAILGVVTPPEDLNVKFLRSLPSEWDTHVVVWMNKPDFNTMGLDDLYNNFKIVEQKVKKSSTADKIVEQNIAKFEKSAKDLDDLLVSQVTNKSKQGFGYNAVPSPHPLILNRPTPLDLSYSGLEEFKQPEVNEYGPRDSSLKPTTGCDKESDNSKENTGDSLKQQQKTNSKTSSVKSLLKVDKDWKEKFFCLANEMVLDLIGVKWETVSEIQANMALMAFTDSEVTKNIYMGITNVTELEKVKEEKEGFEFKIAKFEKSSKDLDDLLASLEEFKQPKVNEYGPRDSSLKPTTVCDRESDNSKENTGDSLKHQHKTVTGTSSVKSPLKVDKYWKEKFFYPANHVREEEPKKARENNDAPINEDWVSDDEEEVEPIPKVEKKTAIPTATKKESVKPEKPIRRSVRYAEMYRSQGPRGNQRNWNGQKSNQLGCNFVFNNKACFNCGSFDHIQYSCPKHMVPRAVLMKTGLKTVNNARLVNTVRSVNTGRPLSTARSFNTVRPSYTAHPKSTSNSQLNDKGFVDSGYSRHMSGNIAHLSDFKDFDGGKNVSKENCVARTPSAKGVGKEAVSTACYVQNRVLIVKPHNKTPYELFRGIKPAIGFMKPFGCHVTILNTLDKLGKFDGKSDEGIQGVSESSTSSQQDQANQDCIVMPIWKDASYFDDASPRSVEVVEVNTGSRDVSTVVPEVNILPKWMSKRAFLYGQMKKRSSDCIFDVDYSIPDPDIMFAVLYTDMDYVGATLIGSLPMELVIMVLGIRELRAKVNKARDVTCTSSTPTRARAELSGGANYEGIIGGRHTTGHQYPRIRDPRYSQCPPSPDVLYRCRKSIDTHWFLRNEIPEADPEGYGMMRQRAWVVRMRTEEDEVEDVPSDLDSIILPPEAEGKRLASHMPHYHTSIPPSLPIPSPVDRRDDIPESEQPPRKRLHLSTIGSRYEIGERDIRDTWVDLAEAVPEIAPMTVGEVNTRVTELAELHEHDTQDLYALLEDAQDSRSRISQRVDMDSQRVDLLMGDRMTLQETVWMVEEEAYASREAWAHSIGLSQATHQELQTHRDHVYAHETHLQAHQTQLQLQGTLIQTQNQMVETLRVIRDMRREMSDMQAELLALREQQRRARKPRPEARIPDHQDASGDADSHI
ncbi:reverse transcriptase domain-containing protein [Tanacetum coccineum]